MHRVLTLAALVLTGCVSTRMPFQDPIEARNTPERMGYHIVHPPNEGPTLLTPDQQLPRQDDFGDQRPGAPSPVIKPPQPPQQ